MKLLIASALLFFLKSTFAEDPIKIIDAIEEPAELFVQEEAVPLRLIEVDHEVSETSGADDAYRLPTSVLPRNYTILLVLQENFGTAGRFTGSVSITLDIQEEVNEITLQAQYIEIIDSNVILHCNGNNEVNLFDSVSHNVTYSKITIKSKTPIPAESNCVLAINEYVGILDDDMRGFYRSSYTNRYGQIE